MIHIARLNDRLEQARLVDLLLKGASRAEIRQQIGRRKPDSHATKAVFRLPSQCTVRVERKTGPLTAGAIRQALLQALEQNDHPDLEKPAAALGKTARKK